MSPGESWNTPQCLKTALFAAGRGGPTDCQRHSRSRPSLYCMYMALYHKTAPSGEDFQSVHSWKPTKYEKTLIPARGQLHTDITEIQDETQKTIKRKTGITQKPTRRIKRTREKRIV